MKSKKPTNEKNNYLKSKEHWLEELSSYDISEKDYHKTEKTLFKKFGEKTKTNDIIWGLFNDAIIRNINDPLKLSSIYSLMGNFIRIEGKNDPNQYYELSTKALLQHYRKKGFKKVRFLASISERTCNICSKLNGKIFDIEEALKDLPTLNKKCKNSDENGYLNCRCALIAVSEDNKNK